VVVLFRVLELSARTKLRERQSERRLRDIYIERRLRGEGECVCVRKKVEKGCEAGAMRFIRDLYPHARTRQERPWCYSRTFQENEV